MDEEVIGQPAAGLLDALVEAPTPAHDVVVNGTGTEATAVFADRSGLIHPGLSTYFNSRTFTDLTVMAPDGRRLACHQIVLSAGSKRFAKILEQGILQAETELPVWGVDSDALESVLRCFYSGMCQLNGRNVVPVMDAAQRLEVTHLAAFCEAFIMKILAPETACYLLEQALHFRMEELSNNILKHLDFQFTEIVATEEFLKSELNTVCKLLGHQRLLALIDDVSIRKAGWQWLVAHDTRAVNAADIVAVVGLPDGLQQAEQLLDRTEAEKHGIEWKQVELPPPPQPTEPEVKQEAAAPTTSSADPQAAAAAAVAAAAAAGATSGGVGAAAGLAGVSDAAASAAGAASLESLLQPNTWSLLNQTNGLGSQLPMNNIMSSLPGLLKTPGSGGLGGGNSLLPGTGGLPGMGDASGLGGNSVSQLLNSLSGGTGLGNNLATDLLAQLGAGAGGSLAGLGFGSSNPALDIMSRLSGGRRFDDDAMMLGGGYGSAGGGGRGRGGRGSGGARGVCQVEGCNTDLSSLRDYHQRYKICEVHLKVPSVFKDGMMQRFCQQCGRFQPLSEFEGNKRSCKARLQRHNDRRRKRLEEDGPVAGYYGATTGIKRQARSGEDDGTTPPPGFPGLGLPGLSASTSSIPRVGGISSSLNPAALSAALQAISGGGMTAAPSAGTAGLGNLSTLLTQMMGQIRAGGTGLPEDGVLPDLGVGDVSAQALAAVAAAAAAAPNMGDDDGPGPDSEAGPTASGETV